MQLPALLFPGVQTDYIFMDWKPQQQTKVYVVRLDGSEVG
jgi:hypothetical protein